MTQIPGKDQRRSVALAREGLPVEVVNLLQVLARIEARRQTQLRASRKERTDAPSKVSS